MIQEVPSAFPSPYSHVGQVMTSACRNLRVTFHNVHKKKNTSTALFPPVTHQRVLILIQVSVPSLWLSTRWLHLYTPLVGVLMKAEPVLSGESQLCCTDCVITCMTCRGFTLRVSLQGSKCLIFPSVSGGFFLSLTN